MEVVQLKTWINVNSNPLIDIIMNNAYSRYNKQIICLIAKAQKMTNRHIPKLLENNQNNRKIMSK